MQRSIVTIQHCIFYALAGRIAFIRRLKIDYIQLILFSRILLQELQKAYVIFILITTISHVIFILANLLQFVSVRQIVRPC